MNIASFFLLNFGGMMKRIAALWMVCLLLVFVPIVSAQELLATTVTNIELGIDELTLQVGERFIFDVRLSPADPDITTLSWIVLDPDIAEMDIASNTVTALNAGETWLFAAGIDSQASAVCHLIVEGGEAKIASKTLGEDVLTVLSLSDEELAKVRDPGLNALLKLLRSVPESALAETDALQNTYKLLVSVVPDSAARVSEAAYALGAADAFPMEEIDLVTLQATVGQIAQLLAGNSDIRALNSDQPSFYAPDVSEVVSKDSTERVPLEGKAAELTAYQNMHDLGIKGKGITIAVIDSGFNTDHPEFKGRIKAQYCTGTTESGLGFESWSPCESEQSAYPTKAVFPNAFSHGTHVAGIAAGEHGIAPEAEMVLISSFTEFKVLVLNKYACGNGNYVEGKDGEPNYCYKQGQYASDELKSYKWLNDLVESGTKVDALNMSYGGGKYSEACDALGGNEAGTQWLSELMKNGVLPIAASGNEWYDNFVVHPSCVKNVMAVGALEDSTDVRITYFSNHSPLIDITAPGSNILSANYLYGYKDPEQLLPTDNTQDKYIKMSGTSMATPMVTGGAALLKQLFPEIGPALLRTLLISSPVDVEMIDRADETGRALRNPTPSIEEFYTQLKAKDATIAAWEDYIKPVLNFSIYNKFSADPEVTVTDGKTLSVSGLPEGQKNSIAVLDGSNVIESISDKTEQIITTITQLEPGKTYMIRVMSEGTDGNLYFYMTSKRIDPTGSIHVTASADGTIVTATVEVTDPDIKSVTVKLDEVSASAQNWEDVSIPTGESSVSREFTFTGLVENKDYTVIATGQKSDQGQPAESQAAVETGTDLIFDPEAADCSTIIVHINGSSNVKSITVTVVGTEFNMTYPEGEDPAIFPVNLVFDELMPETDYMLNYVWTDQQGNTHNGGSNVATSECAVIFRSGKAYANGENTIHVEAEVDPSALDSLDSLLVSAVSLTAAENIPAGLMELMSEDEIEPSHEPVRVGASIIPVKTMNEVDLNVPDDRQCFITVSAIDSQGLIPDDIMLFAAAGPSLEDAQIRAGFDDNGKLTVSVTAQDPVKSFAVMILDLNDDYWYEEGSVPNSVSFSEPDPDGYYGAYIVLYDENENILRTDVYMIEPSGSRHDDTDDDLLFYRLESFVKDESPLPGTGFPTEK